MLAGPQHSTRHVLTNGDAAQLPISRSRDVVEREDAVRRLGWTTGRPLRGMEFVLFPQRTAGRRHRAREHLVDVLPILDWLSVQGTGLPVELKPAGALGPWPGESRERQCAREDEAEDCGRCQFHLEPCGRWPRGRLLQFASARFGADLRPGSFRTGACAGGGGAVTALAGGERGARPASTGPGSRVPRAAVLRGRTAAAPGRGPSPWAAAPGRCW